MKRLVLVAALAFALVGCDHRGQPAEDVAAPAADTAAVSPSLSPAASAAGHRPGPAPADRRAAPHTTDLPEPVRPAYAETNAGSGDPHLDAFVAVVRDRLPVVAADRRDEEIEVLGQQACRSIADGRPAAAVAAETRALGTGDAEATDPATARELVRLATATLCPAPPPRHG